MNEVVKNISLMFFGAFFALTVVIIFVKIEETGFIPLLWMACGIIASVMTGIRCDENAEQQDNT